MNTLKKTLINYLFHKRIRKKELYGIKHDQAVFTTSGNLQLTNDEKNLVRELWGGLIPNIDSGFDGIAVYKRYKQFDPNYIPYSFYYAYIIDALNPVHERKALTNKGMFTHYFRCIRQPRTIIKRMRGVYFNTNNKIISEKEAIENVQEETRSMIIKPILAVGAGEGVAVIDGNLTQKELYNILKKYGTDFIVQEKIQQSLKLAQLNSTSLNTMRLTTFLSKDGVQLLSACVRMGQPGSIADNVAIGGKIVGIDAVGKLDKYGYDSLANRFTEHNGIVFEHFIIPNFSKCVEAVKEAHEQIPICKIVGWDIALDKKNEPVFIEANLRRPGITLEQFCTGPIFGQYTDEVIQYVKEFYRNLSVNILYEHISER